jgi:hypothetical protein
VIEFWNLNRLRRRSREEVKAFARAVETLGATHPRTLERGTLSVYTLRQEIDALEKMVCEWRKDHERQIQRDLIAAERDAREWLLKYPDVEG